MVFQLLIPAFCSSTLAVEKRASFGKAERRQKQLCGAVKADVDNLVSSVSQFDDITLVPDDDSMILVQRFAKKLTEKLSVTPKIANKVSIVVDEIYSNIVNYSGAEIASVAYRIADGRLYMTFEDNGIPYNPLKAPESDVTLSAKEREIGGLGILMVKKMSENMEHRYENNKNILKLSLVLE